MAAIRSRGTKPEQTTRKLLKKEGYKVKAGNNKLPGKPDIFIPEKKVAVFVHGCFWHRHKDCKYAYMPKSNIPFWKKKFAANIERDKTVRKLLRRSHYKAFIIWECAIKKARWKEEANTHLVSCFRKFINNSRYYAEYTGCVRKSSNR